MSTGCQKVSQTDRTICSAPGRQSDRVTVWPYGRIAGQLKSPLLLAGNQLYADLQKVASTQAVLGDTKTPQVPAGDTFWLAWINFLGLVTHIIIRDEKIKGICTCFHHIYTIMCLVHQIGLLCMVFVFWYQIMSRITLFFGQIFVANHAVLVTHFDP